MKTFCRKLRFLNMNAEACFWKRIFLLVAKQSLTKITSRKFLLQNSIISVADITIAAWEGEKEALFSVTIKWFYTGWSQCSAWVAVELVMPLFSKESPSESERPWTLKHFEHGSQNRKLSWKVIRVWRICRCHQNLEGGVSYPGNIFFSTLARQGLTL